MALETLATTMQTRTARVMGESILDDPVNQTILDLIIAHQFLLNTLIVWPKAICHFRFGFILKVTREYLEKEQSLQHLWISTLDVE